MDLRCRLGWHRWSGCRCGRCGRGRDRDHEWEYCRCRSCGATRNREHVLVGCSCRVCGKAMHAFKTVDEESHRCARCGISESHTTRLESRWEDWGGWDSVGPWGSQENDYLVCDRCGWERFVEFTGRIRGAGPD